MNNSKNNTQFSRHRGPVTCAVTIPNSDKIITSAYDSAVALFDSTNNSVRLLGYHQHLVNRVTVNNTGEYAVSSSSDYNLYLWDLKNEKLIRVLKGHDDDVEDFVFIDDKLGASVSRDWRIIIWNLQTGEIKRIIRGHEKDVLSINYYDGKLYTSGDDMTLRIWDVETGVELAKIGPFETETDTCAIDVLNNRIILGCDDGYIRIFSMDDNHLIKEFFGHHSAIKKVAVSPINGDILSAAYDQQIIIWDNDNFLQKQKLESHPALWERSFNWSKGGQLIVAGTFDGTVLIWDAESGMCLKEIGKTHNQDGNACFNDLISQGNDLLVTVSDDGLVRQGMLSHDQSYWSTQQPPKFDRVLMNAITYCADNRNVITGGHNQNIYFFKQEGLQHKLSIELNEGPINCIKVSNVAGYQGEMFVACYSGNLIHLDASGNQLNKIPAHDNAIKALALHPAKAVGVSCCAEGGLISWDYDGNILNEYMGHTAIIDDVDIDPTGQLIASTGRDFTLKIHNLADGVLLHSIHLGRRSPKSLCFISKDEVIVTNYWGELLRVSLNDRVIKRKTIAKNGISSITKHGSYYAASSYDGAIYLIEPDDLKVINTLRSMTQQLESPAYV